MAAQDLVTLEDVRTHLQLQTAETEQDEVISLLITRSSKAITRHCGREFAPPVDSATRRFRVLPDRHLDGLYAVSLAPYDLRAATAVKLHPETAAPLTLTAGVDYLTEPINPVDGVYTDLQLRPASLTWTSTACQNFGFAYLDVTGSWGFEEVPEDVKHACTLATVAALRENVQAFGGALQPNSLGEGVNDPVALPPGVRGLLARYVRSPVF
jgi:hypothetical protein